MNDLRDIKYFKKKSVKLLLFLNKINFHTKINPINKLKKEKIYKTSYKYKKTVIII